MSSSPLYRERLFDMAGAVCLVTGGGRGVGYMIAKALVANGARVYIASRKKEACDQAAKELNAMGPGECISLQANLVSDKDCRELAAAVAARETKLHVLVNNSGVTWGDTLEDFPESAWQKIMTLNVTSIFHLTRACLTMLENAATEENPARVINIGSIAGLVNTRTDNAYSYGASKAAVAHLTRTLAAQFADRNILVNCVAPGIFPSKMAEFFTKDESRKEVALGTIPLSRFGTEQDMGGMALFLCSKAAAYLTGCIIPIDGGMNLGSKY